MTAQTLVKTLTVAFALGVVTTAVAEDTTMTVGYLKYQRNAGSDDKQMMLSGYLAGVMAGWAISQDMVIDSYIQMGSKVDKAVFMGPVLNCIERYDGKMYRLAFESDAKYNASPLDRFVWSTLDSCWYEDTQRIIKEKTG